MKKVESHWCIAQDVMKERRKKVKNSTFLVTSLINGPKTMKSITNNANEYNNALWIPYQFLIIITK